MVKYAAFLRGISPLNPNMRNEKLHQVFENLGFSNVRTVISSGNVLFESPETNARILEAMIEQALPAQLGFTSTVIIRSFQQLKQLLHKDPFKGLIHNPKTYLMVTFLKKPLKAVELSEGEGYKVVGMYNQAVFSIVDTTATKAPYLMVQLEKKLEKQITTRTWKTIERVLKKLNT